LHMHIDIMYSLDYDYSGEKQLSGLLKILKTNIITGGKLYA